MSSRKTFEGEADSGDYAKATASGTDDRMAALGTLAAGAAHEINNPLTYMLLDLERVQRTLRALAAQDEAPTKEELHALAQAIGRAVDGANRVRKTIRDLATFSQGDVERRGLVDVRSVLESAMQMAWHEIRHRARLVKGLSEVPPVEANEARLAQVFLTLLVNAAQAIPEGHADVHEVRVTTRLDESGRAVVEIADTGAGIPEGTLARVFDPFFSTKGEGSVGMGLAVAHGIVRAIGGEMSVASREGHGTTFRVALPVARSYRRISSGSMRAVVPRRRVLLIEDEPLVREALAQALADAADVTKAATAGEGLELCGRGVEFDVVLCDLMMPVMSGMDFYVEVVRTFPHLAGRIVFMSGGVFTPRARSFLESVSNPCLEKPIDMGRLRSLIART
jgi:CheY-like chemotaxis protein